jgi:orotate phosphoribosyltransferase
MIRDEFIIELARFGYWWRPERPFRLASGGESPEYVDCRAALARPHVLNAVAELVLEAMAVQVRAVGGLTMGADPIAVATSLKSRERAGDPIWWFSVRKEPKGHGIGDQIVGALWPGDHVTVVEDVITTGASTILAIRACRENKIVVKQVISLLARTQEGLDAVQAELDKVENNVASVRCLVTMDELRAAWRQLNPHDA